MSKISAERNEINMLKAGELEERIESVRRELLSVRLKHVTNPIKDTQFFAKTRRTLARLLTALRKTKKDSDS